jgi:hypothetical protein
MSTDNLRNEDGSLNIKAVIAFFAGPEGSERPAEQLAEEYDPTFGLSVKERCAASDIAAFVVENARVLADNNGYFNRESYIVEVAFEAGERGHDAETAQAMGRYMADHSSYVNEE